MPETDFQTAATAAIENPEPYWTLPSGDMPIGTLLAYVTPFDTVQLPQGWYVAAGQTVRDPASPFDGQTLPKLTDDRFPMGTLRQHRKEGGSNAIAADGAHSHSGRTHGMEDAGPPHPHGHARQSSSNRNHTHAFDTNGAGNHDHGGDNRPQWSGVVYIIRVK